ncbi:MAG: ECF transporter S component [Oscillospiraceae bacterium]|nr:ECF transporter S component [Oscillospiraceae bacterium]
MYRKAIQNLTISAMLFAMALVLPFFTGQIPQIGSMLLPMHIPVFLCGLLCGRKYGAMVGLLVPVVRSFLFGMPPMFPTAAAMAFELATYGAVAGFVYFRAGYFCMKSLYKSMLTAMIAGRAVWAAVMMVLMGVSGGAFTFEMFMTGAFLNAIPGIAAQLVLIPAIMAALGKTKLIAFGMVEAA